MTSPIIYSQSTSTWSSYNYDTYRVIQTYPHTSDFVSDQAICDEFSLELIPVHCELWSEKRTHVANYKRNLASLTEGNEILSFLDRNVTMSSDQLQSLIIASLKRLGDTVQSGNSCYQERTITALCEHLIQGGEEYYPSEVPGVTDGHFPRTGEQFTIFPSKYSPLPSVSCRFMEELGYGTQHKVPTNTDLCDTTVIPSTRRSMAEVHDIHPFK
jgi:hypothetical protein